MLSTILVIAAFLVIVYNLGAAFWYMFTDKSRGTRTVNALSWRVGLSVALIILVMIGIATGFIEPQGRAPGQ